MEYLKFTLTFCCIMVLFEWCWFILAAILHVITEILARLFSSTRIAITSMLVNQVLYCFLLTSTAILTITSFREINSGIVFLVFMIAISTIYFIFFFADKKNTEEQISKDKTLKYNKSYSQIEFALAKIETLSIVAFIPICFFPSIVTNSITCLIFEKLLFVSKLKYIGIAIGIFGVFSLAKYLFGVLIIGVMLPSLRRKN